MSKKKIFVVVFLIILILAAVGLTWYIFNGGKSQSESNNTETVKNEKTPAASGKDLATFIAGVNNLSKFTKLLTYTGQSEVLKTSSTSTGYIVLAPTNDAFNSLPKGYFDSLFTADKKAIATDITKYHIVITTTDKIANGQKLKTSEGQEVIVAIEDGVYYFTSAKGDKAMAIKKAQKTANGTLYVIDKVLLPQ